MHADMAADCAAGGRASSVSVHISSVVSDALLPPAAVIISGVAATTWTFPSPSWFTMGSAGPVKVWACRTAGSNVGSEEQGGTVVTVQPGPLLEALQACTSHSSTVLLTPLREIPSSTLLKEVRGDGAPETAAAKRKPVSALGRILWQAVQRGAKGAMLYGDVDSGKSAALSTAAVLADADGFAVLRVTHSDIWSSWGKGDTEARLLATIADALEGQGRSNPVALIIDDLHLLMSGHQHQPGAARLAAVLESLVDATRSRGGVCIAASPPDAVLPTGLLLPTRLGQCIMHTTSRGAPAAALHAVDTSTVWAGTSPPRPIRLCEVRGRTDALHVIRQHALLPLLCPSAFYACGVRPPAGVLVTGAAGSGKTFLCHAVAHAAQAAGITARVVSATSLVSSLVGHTEGNVASLFAAARAAAPCLLVLESLHLLAPPRRTGQGHVSGASWDRVLSTILTEMDGVHKAEAPVVLLATADSKASVDPALARPGRLGETVHCTAPSACARQAMVEHWCHQRQVSLRNGQLLAAVGGTEGWSFARLAGALEAASLDALRGAVKQRSACLTPEALSASLLHRLLPPLPTA